MNPFITDFDKIWALIESNEPFAFSRYADGEVALIQGRSINKGTQATDIDKWTAPNKLTKLGEDLKKSLNHQEKNYFYAISCDCCDPDGKEFLLKNIKQKKEFITFSNLWINCNYTRFKDKILNSKKAINLICNQNAKNKNFPFQVKTAHLFPNECVYLWENQKEKIKEKLRENFSCAKKETFFISVGPLSEVLIDYLWSINPNNQYIDVGSALDEFIHGRKTRPYMIQDSPYSSNNCYLNL